MRVGLIGINHKLADLKLREKLAKACQKKFCALQAIQNEHHFILLSTCNRTEVYFTSSDLAATHTYLMNILRDEVKEDFDQKLYSYFGMDCFNHLARVTAGLDSAVVAETEIQGQVKTAYEAVIEYHKIPKELHFLFQKSLGIAKNVRTKLQLGRGMPCLDHAIFNTGLHFFKEIEQTKILFVGASEINLKILSFLKNKQIKNITLCNRSEKAAQMVAKKEMIDVLEWDQISNWHQYDWVIFGTKSPEYLIKNVPDDMVSQKLIMDLSVPRNVEPKISQNKKITLLNIDQLNKLLKIRNQAMHRTLVTAEEMILRASHNQVDCFIQKNDRKLIYSKNRN